MSEFKVILTDTERIETPVWVPQDMHGEIRTAGEWLLATVRLDAGYAVRLGGREWVEPVEHGMTIRRRFDMHQIVEAEEWVDYHLDTGTRRDGPVTAPEMVGTVEVAYVWLDKDLEDRESTVTIPTPCNCPVCGAPPDVLEDALAEFEDGDRVAYRVVCPECMAATGITGYLPESESAHARLKHECSCGRWFTALDWHLHGCWTGSECQYDEPPSILHEYERFLAYDLLCEALGQVGVLAPIRYKHPSRMGRGRGKSCVVSCVSSGRAVC